MPGRVQMELPDYLFGNQMKVLMDKLKQTEPCAQDKQSFCPFKKGDDANTSGHVPVALHHDIYRGTGENILPTLAIVSHATFNALLCLRIPPSRAKLFL